MANKKVMIVEDNPTNMKLAYDTLSIEGFEICSAISAEDALKKISTFNPKVILMDIQLPETDGLTLTKIIKQNPVHANVNIIAMTAYAMNGDREKTLAAGCIDYIAKPADLKVVADLIRKYLEE